VNLQDATQREDDIDRALGEADLDRAEGLVLRYQAAAAEAPVNGDAARAPLFRARYLAAQVALAAGRLRLAARRVLALLPLPAGVAGEVACRVWLISAEALARLGRLGEARQHLARAEEHQGAIEAEPLLRLRVLRVRLWLGDVAELAGPLSSCAAALAARADHANLALLLCEEGRAWDAHGDLDRAEACWLRAEGHSRLAGGGPVRADVLLQLGRLEHLRGHLQAALDRYESALGSAPARPQAQELELRRLLVLLDLNQESQARAAYERALAGTKPEQLPEEVQGAAAMAHALLHGEAPEGVGAELSAHLAAARGDLGRARELYLRALGEAAAPVRRARLALAAGMLALACGDRGEARRWLSEAERLARALDLPEVLWRALQARGQMAAEAGEDEEARRLLEEAVRASEAQAQKLRHRTDAATHRLRRADVLRLLTRAACRRGDAAAVFRYQELDRGRLLLELWRGAPPSGRTPLGDSPELLDLERQIAACADEARREELLLRRDRLFDDYLRDRSRRGDGALPALPELADLEKALPAGTVYAAPTLVEDELYLLVVRAGQGARVVRAPGSALRLTEQVQAFRRCLDGQLRRYRGGWPMGPGERGALDALLEELGQGCLGDALTGALDAGPAPERLLWVPDGALHGLPVHALRRGGRYLVERHEVVFTFGGALFVHQARARRRRRWGRAVVVTEAEAVLPAAAREGAGVAAGFFWPRRLHGPAATRAVLRRRLASAPAVHFACHATFDTQRPLAASVQLPSGEGWRALEWLDEPLAGLPLVTLSACRSAEVAPLVGREVFGLVTGLLGAGARAVVAGLWPVADREAVPFMWDFYRRRLTADLPAALARAQRGALSGPASSPLFWGAFALFGDPGALPAPGRGWRWLARWRQRRHARRFPLAALPAGTDLSTEAKPCPST
jgi:tetratricopeptide (TPR) repeat protein